MNAIIDQDENKASRALTTVLRRNHQALGKFLELIDYKTTHLEGKWQISEQYPAGGGNIDIFLRNGDDSIVIESWSNTMSRMDMSFFRNEAGKWHKQYKIEAPVRLNSKTGLKYVFAEHKNRLRSSFDWKNSDVAILAGRKYLAWGLDVVDRCLDQK
jgi:hypothetical protein